MQDTACNRRCIMRYFFVSQVQNNPSYIYPIIQFTAFGHTLVNLLLMEQLPSNDWVGCLITVTSAHLFTSMQLHSIYAIWFIDLGIIMFIIINYINFQN